MLFFVSRQRYWPDGDLVVEIASGGVEYSNPDMLVEKYGKLGEGLETNDPREALEAAIAVRDAWNADLKAVYEEIEAPTARDPNFFYSRVEIGYTMGMTMPFESYPSDDDLREWAEKAWENTPKCDQCGEPLPEEPDRYVLYDYPDFLFCSDNCASVFYWADRNDGDDEYDWREEEDD